MDYNYQVLRQLHADNQRLIKEVRGLRNQESGSQVFKVFLLFSVLVGAGMAVAVVGNALQHALFRLLGIS